MSVAAAGLEVCSIPGGGQSSPCFAFPLVDRASSRDIEKATLLKVILLHNCFGAVLSTPGQTSHLSACCPEAQSLAQVVESEYAAKYLEFLGANPSQAAQDVVRKALPLTVECLQTKLKVLLASAVLVHGKCAYAATASPISCPALKL